MDLLTIIRSQIFHYSTLMKKLYFIFKLDIRITYHDLDNSFDNNG